MRLTDRDIEIFQHLNRYRYLRRTFIHALLGYDLDHQWLRHRIYALEDYGYLCEPEQQKQSSNYRYTSRHYGLGPKGEEELRERGTSIVQWSGSPKEYWHQLMISDVVASVEIACKARGLDFQHRNGFFDKPVYLSCPNGWVRPDELFTVNGTAFILEADRGFEPNASLTARHSYWAKKIEDYSGVLRNRTYEKEWAFSSLVILCMFASPGKAENVRMYIADTLKKKSKSLSFRGVKVLGSHDTAPEPILSILDDPWQRAGHEPLTILSALESRPSLGHRAHEAAYS